MARRLLGESLWEARKGRRRLLLEEAWGKLAKWREPPAKWREVARTTGEVARTGREEKLWKICMKIRDRKVIDTFCKEYLYFHRQFPARPCQTPQKSSQSLRYNSQARWIKSGVGRRVGGGAKP